jgi:hypothetical protein
MKKIDIEAFKKAWFSFEEAQQVQESLDNYSRTGKWYTIAEAEREIDKRIFAKARSTNA